MKLEEDDTRGRRLLKVASHYVAIQETLTGERGVVQTMTYPCPLCGGAVVRACSGERLSPLGIVADEDGAYGKPHKHGKRK